MLRLSLMLQSKTSKVIALLILLLLLAVGGITYLYIQNRSYEKPTDTTQALISQVGKLVVLPNEEPTVATVTDPGKLKNQLFFANAEVGDKVLIYTGARKAILFRPSADKIIEIAPLNVAAGATSSTP